MELNLVIAITDREKRETLEKISSSIGISLSLISLGRGTATDEHLSLYGLAATEKAVMYAVADREKTARLMRAAKIRLFVDIPGNGIMLSIPIKSVGGGRTMAYLTDNSTPGGETPKMTFEYELIYVILNEGFSDVVMNAARSAGATGGTVMTAKGTGAREGQKFMGITLANERDVVIIVAKNDVKSAIMKSIIDKAGLGTPAGAVCFSLPVSEIQGLHSKNEDSDL
ncbi:MAG: P-II family nitrogen regulator [Clostridia bacterium]|nr:P-II family nitrogen regulator [Clostridia bacterium]